MNLLNGMSGDTNGGICLKEHRSYYTYTTNNSGGICYDVTGYTQEDYITGTYVLPKLNTNPYYSIDIYDETLVLTITGTSMSTWGVDYINALVTTGYTSYDGSTTEERVIFDQSGNTFYKIDHSENSTICGIDTSEKWAIFDSISDGYWSPGINSYYYNELDDCGLVTDKGIVVLCNINELSNTSNTFKYVEKCYNKLLTPSVTTGLEVDDITTNSAIVYGDVTSEGSAAITDIGFCYSIFTNPTIDDIKSSIGVGSGPFSIELANLISDTLYYARAYAINSIGVSYGNEIFFKTDII